METTDIKESASVKTEVATILAKRLELDPTDYLLAPYTPSNFKQAGCDASWVQPSTGATCKKLTTNQATP